MEHILEWKCGWMGEWNGVQLMVLRRRRGDREIVEVWMDGRIECRMLRVHKSRIIRTSATRTRMAPDCRTRRQSSRTVPEGSEGATEVSQATQAPAQGDDSIRVPINNHRIFFFYVAGAGNLHISCRKVDKMPLFFFAYLMSRPSKPSLSSMALCRNPTA